jgi:hypothetical protein
MLLNTFTIVLSFHHFSWYQSWCILPYPHHASTIFSLPLSTTPPILHSPASSSCSTSSDPCFIPPSSLPRHIPHTLILACPRFPFPTSSFRCHSSFTLQTCNFLLPDPYHCHSPSFSPSSIHSYHSFFCHLPSKP